MLAVGVDRAEEELVAEDPVDVDLIRAHFVLEIGPSNADPNEDAVVAEGLHGVERDLAAAGGIDDQVGFADFLDDFFGRGFGRADVVGLNPFDDLTVERAALAAGEAIDLDATKPEDEGGQEADLTDAHDESPLGAPDAHAALGFVG